jgi:hypothetical protein
MRVLLFSPWFLAVLLVGACSDDSKPRPDSRVDSGPPDYQVLPEASVEMGADLEPASDSQPDRPGTDLPQKKEGGSPDLPKAPPNSTCATAQTITLSGGKATIQATTAGGTDEFPTQLKCGGSTTFSGPQVYYRLYVGEGKSYKLKLTPTFSAYLYIFSASAGCSPGPINQYCASAGATGDKLGPINAGSSKALVFSPYPPAGDYIIAIDSQNSYESGSFVLEVEDFSPPTNGTCATAKPITLSGGQATVNGSTMGLKDEFSTLVCGGYTKLAGPQAYYTLPMSTGKAYKITMTPAGFSTYLYLFSATAGCTEAGIEAACGSKGVTGEKWGSFSSASTVYFVPSTSGTYYLAVDSSSSTATGDFTLEIKEILPPSNSTCATAAPITLAGGKTTVTGSTVGSKDEFSTLKCGGYTAFAGPQVYYSLSMSQGKVYKFSITPAGFSAYTYLFSSSAGCSASSIETSCASKVSGDKWGSFYSKGLFFFIPSTSGTYLLGVDSSSSTTQGEFTLDIEETLPPANSTCATAQAITLLAGKATVNGSTVGAKDEFSTLKCGGYTSFAGPQVYYKVNMTAGKSYKLTLTVSGFSAYLYAFPSSANCAQSAIETACASKGTSGDKWGSVYSSSTYTFSPGTSGTYVLAVDSSSSTYAGDFTLAIEESP